MRLSTLLVLGPLLAVVVALGGWVQSLRQEVALLEQRVVTLEINQPLTALIGTSNVGVPFDIDEAMQMESRTPVRRQ